MVPCGTWGCGPGGSSGHATPHPHPVVTAGLPRARRRCWSRNCGVAHSPWALQKVFVWPVASEWFWPAGTQRLSPAEKSPHWPLGARGVDGLAALALAGPLLPTAPPCRPFPTRASWLACFLLQRGQADAPPPPGLPTPGVQARTQGIGLSLLLGPRVALRAEWTLAVSPGPLRCSQPMARGGQTRGRLQPYKDG